MRQIILDTETTGLSPKNGDRLVEIALLELVERKLTGKRYQTYINPEREVSEGASRVTGITTQQLYDKPKFAEIAADILSFIGDSELIIHNAAFDLGFLSAEFELMGHPAADDVTSSWQVIDTLAIARKAYPGKKNNLDALCVRLGVNNLGRTYHGALLDCELLAEVYLKLTAGQTSMFAGSNADERSKAKSANAKLQMQRHYPQKVIIATAEELAQHAEYLKLLRSSNSEAIVWDKIEIKSDTE